MLLIVETIEWLFCAKGLCEMGKEINKNSERKNEEEEKNKFIRYVLLDHN